MYCPNCKSRLYPVDMDYMRLIHVCSYCVSEDFKLIESYNKKKDKEKKQLKKINRDMNRYMFGGY